MRYLLLHIIILFGTSIFSQENKLEEKVNWNGYTQLRASSNLHDNTGFSLRRMKLWMKSTSEFSEHWSYKVQTTISSYAQEKFLLQDIKIAYQRGLFSFDFGQFVPQYSLQRFQADYQLSVIERAKAINTLIPNGTLGVRDIGLQTNFISRNKHFESHIGVFNGNGIKEYRFNNQGYMLTNKTVLTIPFHQTKYKIGYSIQYRKAKSLAIPKILPDTILYTGNDFRYNFFMQFQSKIVEIQAEYLSAELNELRTDGYYLLSTINLKKNQIVLGLEKYNSTLISKPKSYYRLAYNYLIKNDKLKLLVDNYFQINDGKISNYMLSIQLQMFFK